MDFGFDLAHGDAIVREGDGGIDGVGAVIDRVRNFWDGKRVDELREGADVQCGAKFGRGLVVMMYGLGQRERGGEDSALV
jgi:hypothetical protein